ncbi:MAG: 50S ribosomal protein L11 methyltransferase [Bacteroidales bacterium]
MEYLELIIRGRDLSQLEREIIISALDHLGYDGILEDEDDIRAYAPLAGMEKKPSEEMLKILIPRVRFRWNTIPEVNWNERWEQQFQPVIISDKLYIRAPFHPPIPEIPIEIIIQPKMSFGTGHHETTAMLLELMTDLDMAGKQVLDMGCGTGILSVAASKLGAGHVLAVDNDRRAWENAQENCRGNKIRGITVEHGDVAAIKNRSYDIIFANINRNILLRDMTTYVQCLSNDGILALSGFYESDLDDIKGEAEKLHLKHTATLERHKWVALAFRK